MSAFGAAVEFLRSQHLAPLLSAVQQNLVTLNKWSTVGQALQTLGGTNILSAPVLDEDGEYYGCLSVNDLLKALYKVLAAKDPEWFEKIDKLTPQDLVAAATEFTAITVDKVQHAGDLWLLNADDSSSLLDAITESFRIHERAVHHRLFVCCNAHEQKSNTLAGTTVINIAPGSERLSATGLKVTHVVSQSDVIKLLWANKAVLGDALNQTVEQLELDDGKVFSCPASMSTLEALSQMARDHKSSMGVIDPATGRLVGNLSVSDLRGLAIADFPQLLLSVADYIAARRGAPPSIVTVGRGSTLAEVLEALAVKGLHRVYVVDADGKPASIITLTDLLRLITRPPPAAPAAEPEPEAEAELAEA